MTRSLWKGLAEMGFLGIAIPEEFGGAGAGHLELCVIAEEMGRALAPVPFSSTVYLAAEAILLAGSDAQKKKWLPAIASGAAIGTLALFEGKGNPSPEAIKLAASGGSAQRRQEAGARRRHRRFRRGRRPHRLDRARQRHLAVPGRPEGRRRRSQGA